MGIAIRREMFESEATNGHRGVFELLHLNDKASGAGVASLSPREFPLYYGGKELKPFQYALFLLGKVCRIHRHRILLASASFYPFLQQLSGCWASVSHRTALPDVCDCLHFGLVRSWRLTGLCAQIGVPHHQSPRRTETT